MSTSSREAYIQACIPEYQRQEQEHERVRKYGVGDTILHIGSRRMGRAFTLLCMREYMESLNTPPPPPHATAGPVCGAIGYQSVEDVD